jgi:NADPH-dependent 2,4-dienoyl-CoA reductase/sulfur reductase-like enzyme
VLRGVQRPELGALVHAGLAARGVQVLTGTTVQGITRPAPGQAGRLEVEATAADGSTLTRAADIVLVVVGVRLETTLAADAGPPWVSRVRSPSTPACGRTCPMSSPPGTA